MELAFVPFLFLFSFLFIRLSKSHAHDHMVGGGLTRVGLDFFVAFLPSFMPQLFFTDNFAILFFWICLLCGWSQHHDPEF